MSRVRFVNIGSYNVAGLRIVTEGVSGQRLQSSVFHILNENVLCSIATVDAQNRAHINTAYFSYSDELELFFLSHPSSLHCRNLLTNSSVALTIFSSYQTWTNPGLGLQLFGIATKATGSQIRKAEKLYSKRFPAHARWKSSLSQDDVAREYRLYRIVTTRLKLHDEKSFGDGVFLLADVENARRTPIIHESH